MYCKDKLSVIWGLTPVLCYPYLFAGSQGLEVERALLDRCLQARAILMESRVLR